MICILQAMLKMIENEKFLRYKKKQEIGLDQESNKIYKYKTQDDNNIMMVRWSMTLSREHI